MPSGLKVLVRGGTGGGSYGRTAVKKMVRAAGDCLGLGNMELSVFLADNETMRELNRRYRSIDRPTDVLSFPLDDESLLGDIAVSLDKARAQATEFNVTYEQELARLLVHGLLHLVGYDHVKGGRQARAMRAKEEEILGALRALLLV